MTYCDPFALEFMLQAHHFTIGGNKYVNRDLLSSVTC